MPSSGKMCVFHIFFGDAKNSRAQVDLGPKISLQMREQGSEKLQDLLTVASVRERAMTSLRPPDYQCSVLFKTRLNGVYV